LTPLDFLLWGMWRTLSTKIKINDHKHLKACIRDVVAMVTPNILQAMWNKVEYRLDICRATKGTHIEIFW
jgi:hypothetical protein